MPRSSDTPTHQTQNSDSPYSGSLNFIRKRFAHKLEAAYTAKDGALPNSKPYAGFEAFMGVLQRADPTARKRYLPWITLQYIRGHFYANQDTGVIREALTVFHKNKYRMTIGKDISQYASLSDLYQFIAQFEEQASIPEGLPKALHNAGEATLVHYSADTMIIVPHTESASQQLGSGTKWCTAAREDCAFDLYDNNGPLIIIKHKGRKYQIHYEIGDFRDGHDGIVNDSTRLMLLAESIGIKELQQHKVDAGYSTLYGDLFHSTMTQIREAEQPVLVRRLQEKDGSVVYRNQYGEPHSPDNDTPAILHSQYSPYPQYSQEFYRNGILHRSNGLPAIVFKDGGVEYYEYGVLHRDNDLPAVIRADGHKEWRVNGKLNRGNDLPALIDADGNQYWYQDNKPMRKNGLPCIIRANGRCEYYTDGVWYSESTKAKVSF